jgi:hypothetical protein
MKRTKTWVVFLLIGLLVLLSVACQSADGLSNSNSDKEIDKAPETSDSNWKANNYEEIIFSTSAPNEAFEAPKRWLETIELNEKLKLEINVSVELRDSTHPVYVVSHKKPDSSFLLNWILAAFPNTNSVRKEAKSLEELQNELQRLERGMYAGMDENWAPIFEPYDEEEKREMQDAIQAQIESMPEKLSFLPLAEENIVLQDTPIGLLQADGSFVWISGFANDTGSIVFLNTEHDPNIQRESWLMQGERMPGGPGPIDNIKLTQSEAEEIASTVFKRYGRDEYQLAYAQKARNVSIFPTWGDITSVGWYLIYTPSIAGTEAAFYNEQNAGAAFRYNRPYTKGWKYEAVEFYISNRGIEQIVYSYPYEIVSVANENVPLLPFTEVQNSVCTFIKQGYEWTEKSDAGIGDSLVVSKMLLTEAIVPQKSDSNHAILIPAWAVYYQSTLLKSLGFEDNVLLVNAVDGTLIQTY